MNKLRVLKIKIYQPQAQYRIPFTYKRRLTYPVPPYSTVLGLIANMLGVKNVPGQEEPCVRENCECVYHKYKELKISICGKFKVKTTEYVWLRNLEKGWHTKRFGSTTNRCVGGHIEHIGGQMPCYMDVLNDVEILIHLYHRDRGFLELIEKSFLEPKNRTSTLHLGRAEDILVLERIWFEELEFKPINGQFDYFFWVPQKMFSPGEDVFDSIQGLTYDLPTFYRIKNGAREFDYIKVKLSEGDFGGIKAHYDNTEEVPVFLADPRGG